MDALTRQNVTLILEECVKGNNNGINELLPYVYLELKRISSKYLAGEYRNNTLQTTDLVHEAYLKMVGQENMNLQNRAHFFGIAARSMRQVLVDRARRRNAGKRGDGQANIDIDQAPEFTGYSDQKILELDEALKKLETVEARSCKVIELRFFSGFTIDETAQYLNISRETAKRDWTFAKAWLYREMKSE